MVDATRRPGTLAWLYQRGLTFDEATKTHEFMYINFWHKKEPANDGQALFKHQESHLHEWENPVSEIDFIDGMRRPDVPTAIRIARSKYHPEWQNMRALWISMASSSCVSCLHPAH